jgi:four helix bundle protein
MAKYEVFEQTPAWQEAAHLYNLVWDMTEEHGPVFSAAFRNQLDRAALQVSCQIAEGFDRWAGSELEKLLVAARGSASQVRSLCLAVEKRPKLAPARAKLSEIVTCAESCARQLGGWIGAIEAASGKRPRPAAAGDSPAPSTPATAVSATARTAPPQTGTALPSAARTPTPARRSPAES